MLTQKQLERLNELEAKDGDLTDAEVEEMEALASNACDDASFTDDADCW